MSLKFHDSSNQEPSKGLTRPSNAEETSNSFRTTSNLSIDITQDSSGDVTQIEEVSITFDDSHLTGQCERLQEEFDLTDDETDIIWRGMHSLVSSIAEEKNKQWSDEVVETVTNLMISMFIQEERQKRPI